MAARRNNFADNTRRKFMSEIPMQYKTGYSWSGTEMAGHINIAGLPPLPVGSPHDAVRFSPEHLLVATVEACLGNYILLFAGLSKLEMKAYHSTATGELERSVNGGYRFRRIVIRPVLHVPGASVPLAGRVVGKAHNSCLIARSLNCEVVIEPAIET
jgi:organic hydroperoxide reductase OsmC/OhrA